ncbi:MAG: GNAT family N-acetyltransferase [Nanoarchaeota archaeon]
MRCIFGRKEHVAQAARLLDWYDSVSVAKKRVIKKMGAREFLVVLMDGRVVGVLLYARDYSHDANYCEDLIVEESARRKGVGSLLLNKFIELCRAEQPKKQPYAFSSTDVTNVRSIALHEKVGFRNLGIVKKLHYGKDEIFFGYKL